MTPIDVVVKGMSLKDYIRRVGRHIKMIFSQMIHHSTKGMTPLKIAYEI